MKKFIFVVSLTANDDNKNFCGEKREYAYGKSSSLEIKNDDDLNWFAKTYGYTRKCDAARQMKWHQNNLEEKYWNKEYRLVEVCA